MNSSLLNLLLTGFIVRSNPGCFLASVQFRKDGIVLLSILRGDVTTLRMDCEPTGLLSGRTKNPNQPQLIDGRRYPKAPSTTAAIPSAVSSSKGRATICTPMGKPSGDCPTGTTAAGAASALNHCECRQASRYSTARPSISQRRSPWRNAGTLATAQSNNGYRRISSSVLARRRSSSAHAFKRSEPVNGDALAAIPKNSLKIGLNSLSLPRISGA